jgi:hypothetical protein
MIIGFHGCERSVARAVLLGKRELEPSNNDYDWLGSGVYFWEHGLTRAQQFAEEKRARGELRDPVVIGAYLQLGTCFDLTDTWATQRLSLYYENLRAYLTRAGLPLPSNAAAPGSAGQLVLRRRDCAVLNHCLNNTDLEARLRGRDYGFDSVRGAFEEGPPAFEGAAVRLKSHVQISIRNPACILGLFRPAGYSL